MPDSIDPNAIKWTGSAAQGRERDAAKDAASIRSSGASAASSEAALPFIAPKANLDLASGEQSIKTSKFNSANKLYDDFAKRKEVVAYNELAPMLASALTTDPTPTGDLSLSYAAAKLFDPGSVVRESEQGMLAGSQSMWEQASAKIAKDWGLSGGGTFSDDARMRLRAELVRRYRNLEKSYNLQRQDFTKKAERQGFDPDDVIGSPAGEPFEPDIQQFEQGYKQLAQAEKAGRKPEGGHAGLFERTPDGGQVAGEPIKGYRFSAAQEKSLQDFANSPGFTPEGIADMMAGFAQEQGVPVGDEYRRDALAQGQLMAQTKKENPNAVFGSVNYGDVDRSATENAPLSASIAQGLANAPESAANLVAGLFSPGTDLVDSIITKSRQGLYKTIPDIVGDLAHAAGAPITDSGTLDALGSVLKDRYGGLGNLKRSLISDPVGVVGDVSAVLTAGGSTAARAPGMLGTVGREAAQLGARIDPLTMAGRALSTDRAAALGERAMEGVGQAVNIPSGVGAVSPVEAMKAGYRRGREGPNAPSQAFVDAMRGNDNPGDVVQTARNAVRNLRDEASRNYQAGMAQFGANPQPLDINVVRQRMASIKPENYDAMLGAPERPTTHRAWDQMNNAVEHYANAAASDPNLLLPMQMDAFKQDLYDIGSRIGGVYDREANRIASTAYHGVRDELVRHDPIYAQTMGDYSKASDELHQLENTFALREGRGKPVDIDRATRRLQSIMRNNANTGYGQRVGLAERLQELDPTGTLMPSLAGQTMSAATPRGLRASVGATGLGLGAMGLGAGMASPLATIPALAMSSPRIAGEVLYNAAALPGLAVRGIAENPGVAKSLQVANRYSDASQDEFEKDFARRYGVMLPGEEDEGY